MRKIVVASDSFKGSLSSMEVAESVELGVREVYPDCEVVKVIVADGGEGTTDAVMKELGGDFVTMSVHDPLGRPIEARYGIADDLAVIEMATASGLTLLSPEERNPLKTSTYGTGEMILDAINRGCTRLFVGIGGSATNDAGTGMLQALGFRFYNANGEIINTCCGAELENISYIDDKLVPNQLRSVQIEVACDVDTPFCGEDGAAYVFAPQKGATEQMVKLLDSGMASFAKVINTKYYKNVESVPGAGAAGGLGGAFYAFLNAELKKGVDMVLDIIAFDNLLKGVDMVITGEGKIDYQSPKGKTTVGILNRAKKQNIPVVAIGGRVEMCESVASMGFMGVYPISSDDIPLNIAMQQSVAKENVKNTVKNILLGLKSS